MEAHRRLLPAPTPWSAWFCARVSCRLDLRKTSHSAATIAAEIAALEEISSQPICAVGWHMSALTKGRKFQLWEYHVSHGSLLIRSPAGPGVETSIDIVCVGVEYLAAPRHLGEIIVCPATEVEVERLEGVLQKKLSPSRVWVLESASGRFPVVGVSLQVQEHRGDIFESPFGRGVNG
jgi:hypothetical protein